MQKQETAQTNKAPVYDYNAESLMNQNLGYLKTVQLSKVLMADNSAVNSNTIIDAIRKTLASEERELISLTLSTFMRNYEHQIEKSRLIDILITNRKLVLKRKYQGLKRDEIARLYKDFIAEIETGRQTFIMQQKAVEDCFGRITLGSSSDKQIAT